MSSSNLLKGFGVGADVIGQLAVDKAMRRKSTGVVRGFDITDGELLEEVKLLGDSAGDPPSTLKHSLNRVPKGVIVLATTDSSVELTGKALKTVTIDGPVGTVVTLWVI